MSQLKKAPKKPSFIELDETNIKEFKLCVGTFGLLLLLMFHYAWIMRQWVRSPNMATNLLIFYFSTLALHLVGSGFVLVKVIYKRIYEEDSQARAIKKTQ